MHQTRRGFLQLTLAATMPALANASTPWYLRTYRWGQTNITEKDPERYDIAWWRDYWKRTAVEGVIINAGGIVAYYPSKFPLHHRAQFLNGRDLFGELTEAAHKDGLVVMARMDSSRTAGDFFEAHPDWFARTADGQPYRTADKYTTCIHSPYYDEYLPEVLREIAGRAHPEGFTDNSWAGLGRSSICYCANCEQKFRAKTGQAIPRRTDWDDPAFRQWILWSYARRLEVWDLNNRTTQAAGGKDCIWSGMNSGSITSQASSFRDLKEIAGRAHILMLDHQRRDDATGFQQNSETGKRVHGLLGWDKLAPESMAMYQAGRTSFRMTSKPAAEARQWMIAGIAGGLQPWWHHVGAYQEDRRMFRTAEPVMQWCKVNQAYLVNRQPVATIGMVWSQRNTDFYGRDQAGELVDAPGEGFVQALIRARIPYVPVHADHIDREAAGLAVLILANVGGLSDEQCPAIRRFVAGGGGLIATSDSTLYDEWGDPRSDFALAGLLGVHLKAPPRRPATSARALHTYLRLHPEMRAGAGGRHAVLGGFEETDILPFGGMLQPLETDPGAVVPLTLVPEFPVGPPETAWMREPDTGIPALVVREQPNAGRVAYLAADLDRRYLRDLLPDHANLLANLVRWAANGRIPLSVQGPGLIDCNLYQQRERMILHLVNLTSAGTWRSPMDELIPVGALKVGVKLPPGTGGKARQLVSTKPVPVTMREGWAEFEVKSVLDHEVIVIG